MYSTQTHIFRTPIFQEFSQKDIQKEIMSNKILETTLSVLKELNIKGYIYGQYVRNLFLSLSSEAINIWVFGDVIKVGQNIKAKFGTDCIINISKKTKTVILTFRYTKQISLVLTNTIYSFKGPHKAPRYFSSEYFLSYCDLTIDSLGICLYGEAFGSLINPYNGLEHIRTGCITTISDARKVFKNNPDLILECLTLLSYPNFYLDEKCKNEFKTACSLYKISDNKRELVNEMMSKIIYSSKFSLILSEMHEFGFLSKILPEVTALDTTEYKKGFTYRNDFIFTLKMLDEICQKTENITLRLITLFLYIGKFKAKKFDQEKGWTFHGTYLISGKMIPPILKRLGLDYELKRAAYYKDMIIMLKHILSIDIVKVSDSAIRRIITNAGENLNDLLLLYDSYKKAQHQIKSTTSHTEDYLLQTRIQHVKKIDSKNHITGILCINGHMISEMFPKCTGRQIGQLKQKMAQDVLEGKVSNDYESLLSIIVAYAKELGIKEKDESDTKLLNFFTPNNIPVFTECRIIQKGSILTINKNGTYIIEDYEKDDNISNSMVIEDPYNDKMVMQCYETGCVNKVRIDEIIKLRKYFLFNNGIYRKALLQTILIGSDKDTLLLKGQNEGKDFVLIMPAALIKEHSMLGLKGTTIIKNFNVQNWYIAKNCDEQKIQGVFHSKSFPILININEGVTDEIANWIKDHIF